MMDSHVPLEPGDSGTTNRPAENPADDCLVTRLPPTHVSSEDDILLVDSAGTISPFNQNLDREWKTPRDGRTVPLNQRFPGMWQLPHRLLQRLAVRNALRRAVERDELALYWQPQATVETGRIVGAEALVRWLRPGGTVVLPGEFLPAAEEEGLMGGIGEWVLRTACAQNRARQEAGVPPVRVSVNLTADQLCSPDLVDVVARILKETGLDAEWLGVEITESATMQHLETAASVLQGLRQMGIRISLDDFGIGYFSIAQLKDLPIQELKIDKSLIQGVTVESRCAVVTSAIIALASSLDLDVVAEGVETVEQLEFLRAHGCGAFQGYLLSSPLPTREFDSVLMQHARI